MLLQEKRRRRSRRWDGERTRLHRGTTLTRNAQTQAPLLRLHHIFQVGHKHTLTAPRSVASCLSHTRGWVMLPWIQKTTKLQRREFCYNLCSKIDQKVENAPYFLFFPNQNSRHVKVEPHGFYFNMTLEEIDLHSHACLRAQYLLISSTTTLY